MNMISKLQKRIHESGFTIITLEEFNQLQAEWITRTHAGKLEEELALTKQKLEAATRQSANRLIGLCKCGIEREELTTKLEAANIIKKQVSLMNIM